MTQEDARRFVSIATWNEAPADVKFLVDLVRRLVHSQVEAVSLAVRIQQDPHAQGRAFDTLGPGGVILHHTCPYQ